jgi:hypothetical protein
LFELFEFGISNLDIGLAHHTLRLTAAQRICHQSRPSEIASSRRSFLACLTRAPLLPGTSDAEVIELIPAADHSAQNRRLLRIMLRRL